MTTKACEPGLKECLYLEEHRSSAYVCRQDFNQLAGLSQQQQRSERNRMGKVEPQNKHFTAKPGMRNTASQTILLSLFQNSNIHITSQWNTSL